MIFYDGTNQRKYIARTSTVFCIASFLFLIGLFVASVHTDQTAASVHALGDMDEMQIVLTFDDGPHPEYTPAILKILEEKNVPAAFFFIGHEMIQYPEVVRSTFAAGHEIGNHSFTHSENVHKSKERMHFELEATNQVIERLTGERAHFYRSPYLNDFANADAEFVTHEYTAKDPALQWLNELGYVGVSAYIDPRDWDVRETDVLIERVLERTQHGNILLLHDGGEQKEVTLTALPQIIDALQAEGFTFVSLHELSGINTYTTPNETLLHKLSTTFSVSVLGTTYSSFQQILFAITALAILLGITRLLLLLTARALPCPHKPHIFGQRVSILIPAYNEEENVEATIISAGSSTHEHTEIVVIDDGSTDHTKAAVLRAAQRCPVPVRYVYKENGGKAAALNVGIQHARFDIIVAIDGDTIIHPDAVCHLVSHFNDTRVGAVAGRVSAITNKRWLSWFQDIEYTVSQNIEKIAFNSLFGSISVIPGAIGAWRKEAIIAAGGYSTDTQVEDQDLTLAIHAAGYKVKYDSCAIAYTEVPDTIQSFIRQRFRWTFGTLQCLWKYIGYSFDPHKPQLGFIIIPYGVFFSVVSPLMMPVIDMILIYSLLTGISSGLLILSIVFLSVDMLYHFFGFLREPKKLWYLPLVIVQRLFYRLILSFVFLKSLVYAIEGTRSLWGTQIRTGAAKALFFRQQSPRPLTVVHKSTPLTAVRQTPS